MLQILIEGTNATGWLDMPPGAALDIETLNEAWDEDLSTGEYTLPVEIQWTDNNRRLLNYTERLSNDDVPPYWLCSVYDDGWPQMQRAKLTLVQKNGRLNYLSGSTQISISGTKGLYASTVKGKKLTDLPLGGIIRWQDMDSREFATMVMKDNPPQYSHIAFAPVAIENFFDTGRADYDDEFLAKDCVNYAVRTGGGTDDWLFARPTPDAPDTPVTTGNEGYADYRTVPFLKLKYVVRQCFETYGYAVKGHWIDNPDWDALYLFNQCGVEKYPTGTLQDINRVINPANHVPDVLIYDFLKAVFKFFGLFPKFLGDGTVQLVHHKYNIEQKQIVNLSPYIAGTFESVYPGQDAPQGYKLEYSWDGADSYNGDRVKDLNNKNLVGTVNNRADLDTLNIGRSLTTDDIALVRNDNLYYCVADGTVVPALWDCYGEALQPYQHGNGEDSVTMGLSPLCTYAEFNDDTALVERRPYCGCRQTGSYNTNKGGYNKAAFGIRIMYIQKQEYEGVTLPVSFVHNRNQQGNIAVPYSLAWNAPNGMAQWHTGWQRLKRQRETVKIPCSHNARVMELLATANVVEVDGVQLLHQKTERTLPAKDDMLLWLVPV